MNEQLTQLENSVIQLLESFQKLQEENNTLKASVTQLEAEKAELLANQESVARRLDGILETLGMRHE